MLVILLLLFILNNADACVKNEVAQCFWLGSTKDLQQWLMWTVELQIKQQLSKYYTHGHTLARCKVDLKDSFKCSLLYFCWYCCCRRFFGPGVHHVSPVPGYDAPNTRQCSLSSANPPLKPTTSNEEQVWSCLHVGAWMLKHHTPAVIFDLMVETRGTNLENIGLTLEATQWICFPLDNNNSGTTTKSKLLSDFHRKLQRRSNLYIINFYPPSTHCVS